MERKEPKPDTNGDCGSRAILTKAADAFFVSGSLGSTLASEPS
jgi:hypothetical protein